MHRYMLFTKIIIHYSHSYTHYKSVICDILILLACLLSKHIIKIINYVNYLKSYYRYFILKQLPFRYCFIIFVTIVLRSLSPLVALKWGLNWCKYFTSEVAGIYWSNQEGRKKRRNVKEKRK